MYTAPQRRLLKEFASRFSAPKLDPYIAARMGLGSEQSKNADNKQGKRSGNLEFSTKHKKLMGQSDNPHQTRAQKPGRPPASRTRPEGASEETGSIAAMSNIFRDDPSGLTDLGEPYTRGLSQQMVGNDAELHPSKGTAPARIQGFAENPGKQSWTGFGNRYPGSKTGNFN